MDVIGNKEKRPEGYRQALKALEKKLRDGAYKLFPITSNQDFRASQR